MPVAATASYVPPHPQSPPQSNAPPHAQQQPPMVGYGQSLVGHHNSPSPATMDMDAQSQRSKYSSSGAAQQPVNANNHASPASYASRPRSANPPTPMDQETSKSGSGRRSSSRDGRSRRSSRSKQSASHHSTTSHSHTAVQYQQQPNNPGSAPASSRSQRMSGITSNNNPHAGYSQQPPAQTQQPMLNAPNPFAPKHTQGMATPSPEHNHSSHHHSTTHNAMQPSFPPAAVTNDSPTQVPNGDATNPSQRRPAYLLHRDLVIGKGSYGQVCIASRGEPEGHQSSSRAGKRKKFACKCVLLRNDPKYIAKLQEEVNVLRELRGHDNVIRLYDVFCVDNELFIITELGRGGDLFHLLTTHPKHGVTEAYAAKTVAEMLSSVAFLHSRSICHRDLKLENWVLESGKDVWSPLKLIDFGLSTHFVRGQRLSRVVGSSYYVAPEVLKKSYTEACDLWSLGVIVYMLLSGAPPFYGKNDEAIKASIVQGEYTFPHELFRDVSDEAMAFVSTLLSYNIEYRYTAEQALTHPWLAANCDPDSLQRTKNGAQGIGIASDASGGNVGGATSRPEPMQL